MIPTERSVLVTGGAGFIGANFVHYWLGVHPGDRVVVLDALTYAGDLASLEPALGDHRCEFEPGDIRDQFLVEGILRERGIDTIVHFAAESHVDRSILGPDAFIETNVGGTHALLKAAKRVWLDEGPADDSRRFHHVSTDEVFGSLGPDDPPFTERTPYAPNSPYAASKAASDHLVRAYHRTYGLPVISTNCSNNYGPYQFPEKLIPLTIVNALEGRPLPVYGDGLNRRDWLFVEDHCRGIDAALARGTVGETYNLGGGHEATTLGIVRAVCEVIDWSFLADQRLRRRFPRAPAAKRRKTETLIAFVPDRPGHDRRYAVDAARAARELGFHTEESFESGIRRSVAWYLEHEAWWRGVMDGSYRDWMRQQYPQLAHA